MITVNLVSPTSTIVETRPIDTAVATGSRAALMRFGAFERRAAQTSLRYRKKPSAPGSPPSAHRSDRFSVNKTNRKTGVTTRQQSSPLRELIRFAVVETPRGLSVITGPLGGGSRPGDAPHALETGGGIVVRVPLPVRKGPKAGPRQAQSFRRLVKDGRIIVPPREYREETIPMAARPFMGPSFRRELGKAAGLFEGSVRG